MNNPMTYIQNGDYLIPDLKLSQQPEKPLGKYGRMRKAYLKEHRPILYNQLLMNLSRVVEKIAFPYLMIIQMIPILGMAPIILSITGDINSARIAIAAILTFYPVSTNVLAGFRSVEKEKHELMYSYAANKFQLYTKTLIPACIPYFFTGLKISAPMAITASILVDTLQGGNGLGCMLSQSLKGGMTRLVFWDIVLISAVIGILSFVLMGLIERLLCPYKRNRSSD